MNLTVEQQNILIGRLLNLTKNNKIMWFEVPYAYFPTYTTNLINGMLITFGKIDDSRFLFKILQYHKWIQQEYITDDEKNFIKVQSLFDAVQENVENDKFDFMIHGMDRIYQ